MQLILFARIGIFLLPYVSWAYDFIDKPDLILGEGEQRLLKIPDLNKYSIGSSHVRVLPLRRTFSKLSFPQNDALLIKGITAGLSDLWVWKRNGPTEHRTIRVEKNTQMQNIALAKALSKLQEAEIIYLGKGVVVRGLVSSLPEAARVSAIVRGHPHEVFDETVNSPELVEQGKLNLETWLKTYLKNSALRSFLRIEQIGDTLWLRGSVNNLSEKTSIEKQLRALFPPLRVEVDAFPDQAPTVYFRVFLLELKKSKFHTVGLSWPHTSPDAFQVSTSKIQDSLQMGIALQQLEGTGNAKILSNPELVVRAPGEAELFAGGEIPIQTQNRYFSNTAWKNYGLTLRLKVTHISGNRVRLDIFTEVSHLDSSLGQEKIPGIQANRMKTQVDAQFGVPLLLSGLLQEGVRQEAKGLPFLRNIPILGLLFGSQDYLNDRSELVAILYPHFSPPSPQARSESILPRGSPPFPRNWLDPTEELQLKEARDYPWNVLN